MTALLFTSFISFGCVLDVSTEDFSSNTQKIEAFTAPQSFDFTSSSSYLFSWKPLPSEGNTLALSTYLVSVFENTDCEGKIIVSEKRQTNDFQYDGFIEEGQRVSLGIQVVDERGYAGPLICSSAVERDNTPPFIDMQIAQTSPSNSTTLQLTGQCYENKMWSKLRPMSLCVAANCTSSQDYSESVECRSDGTYSKTVALVPGVYDVVLRAEDQASNFFKTEVLNFVVDHDAPEVTGFTSHTSAQYIGSTSFKFLWTGVDTGLAGLHPTAPYYYSLHATPDCSGTATTSGSTAQNYFDSTNLINTEVYSLRVQALDAAGNYSAPVCSPALTVAVGAPSIALSDLTNTIVAQREAYSKTQNVTVTVSQDASAVGWCLSESQTTAPDASSCSGTDWLSSRPTSFSLNSSDGIKTVYLWVKDAFDNVITPSTSYSITLDRTNPTPLAFASPAASTPTQGSPLSITASCEVGLNIVVSGDVVAQTLSCSSSPLTFDVELTGTGANATKTVTLTQTDLASNSSSVSRNFIKDTLAPVLAFTSPTALSQHQTQVDLTGTCEVGLNVNISGTGTSGTSQVMCTGAGTFSSTVLFSPGEGNKLINIAQTDAAGNSTNISRAFVRDNTAPVLAFTSPTALSQHQTQVDLTGTCEAGLNVNISGTGTAGTSQVMCTGAGTFSSTVLFSSGEGNKPVNISQTDSAGNSTSISRTFVRDNTAPVLAFTSPAALTLVQTGLTIQGSCEEGYNVNISGDVDTNFSVSCLLNSFTALVTFSSGDGTKNVVISQTDQAGNTGSANRNFSKDDTDPTLVWTSPTDGTNFQSALTATGTCETGLDVVITGSGLNFPITESCLSGTFSRALSMTAGDGPKTVNITQTDAAGNSKSITREFVKDNLAPVLTRTTGASPGYSNLTSFTWGGACEAGHDIAITGAADATILCNGGSWTWTTPAVSGEGAKDYTLTHTDAAGNSSALSLRWYYDVTAPTFTMAQTSPMQSNTSSITLSGNCEGNGHIAVSDATTDEFNCVMGAYTYTTPAVSTDATYTYTLTHYDAAGNFASQSMIWTRDTTGPALTLVQAAFKSSGDTVTFSGTCELGLNISISGAQTASFACPGSGSWTWTTDTVSTDGERTYTISQSNGLGTSTSHTGKWIRDTTGPTFTHLSLNGGETITGSYIVDVALAATDAYTEISHFCLKRNSTTAPTLTDSCWRAVNAPSPGIAPNKSIAFSNYKMAIDFTPGYYRVYAWAKDLSGNISGLTAAGNGSVGIDRAEITYFVNPAPIVKDVIAANTDAPSAPPSSTDTNTPAGSSITIKWHASDDVALPATPIKLFISTDTVNWNLVADNLLNSSNGGCVVNHPATTVDDVATGCYVWENSSPTNSFFMMRITATDIAGSETAVASNPLNSSNIKLLAGNTDPGTGGSGNSALFFGHEAGGHHSAINGLAVTRSGVMFFRDMHRGLLWVNPDTGKQEVFIRTTGSSSGDGGAVTSATLADALRITLDHQDRLLIYDKDRIRRVDTNVYPMTIETIIGGGSSLLAEEDALTIHLNPNTSSASSYVHSMPFFALPNGNIWFVSDRVGATVQGGFRLGIYDASTDRVSRHAFSGTGTVYETGYDVTAYAVSALGVAYDPITSEIHEQFAKVYRSFVGDSHTYPFSFDDSFTSQTPHMPLYMAGGRDTPLPALSGKLYGLSNFYNRIGRYDHVTRTWTTIAGSGVQGECVDGTPALSCNMTPRTLFVNADDQVFFLDNGAIRTIDNDNNIVTVMGQSMSWGDGELATSARLVDAVDIEMWNDGGTERYVVLDRLARRMKEFSSGGTIDTIAGNGNMGVPNLQDPASTQSLNFYWEYLALEVDPLNGDIYSGPRSSYISRLDRSIDRWVDIIGGGANSVHVTGTDGQLGTDIRIPQYWPTVFGLSGTHILSAFTGWSAGVNINFIAKLFTKSNGQQSHFVGRGDDRPLLDNCPENMDSSLCEVNISGNSWRDAHYNAHKGEWYFTLANTAQIRALVPGSTVRVLETLPRSVTNFTFDDSGPHEMLYYCSAGRIFKFNRTTKTESQLPWDDPTMSCKGQSLIYNEARNTLVFTFSQNGLTGVAEYNNP